MGILETICEARRQDLARAKALHPASSLHREASPPRPAFGRSPFLIAECKRASPSKGLMVADYRPTTLARAYEEGGAALVSVITEARHFMGEEAHLSAVREAVGIPVLRKDFILDPWQLRESWALGADVVLLIAAILEPARLAELAESARELGLSVLVEVREAAEIGGALAARPDALGFNARDLRDFSVDSGRAAAMARELRALAGAGLPLVAESGMKLPEEAAALRRSGYEGFLVGEALATSADPRAAARAFVAAIEAVPAEAGAP